ncbi:hypothetical protein DRN67_04100 [Candidatus Micrarchaeota archaeon]|nr:MAG: hypothetical protein DRN67_04100 [Candidatus Micrarchaeota archaeon]
MKLNKNAERKLAFVLLFGALALIGSRINYSAIIGADNQTFTLFQFFGPIAGSFLGAGLGVAAILLSELSNYFLQGRAFDAINILRLLPMLFAAVYFSRSHLKFSAIIPALAILLFWLHPVGIQVWYYPLIFWLIPLAGTFVRNNLLVKSLGSTLTAHAIGSIVWLYTVPMSAAQWNLVIPLAIMERFSFALGIAVSYIVVNYALDALTSASKTGFPYVDKRYSLSA